MCTCCRLGLHVFVLGALLASYTNREVLGIQNTAIALDQHTGNSVPEGPRSGFPELLKN